MCDYAYNPHWCTREQENETLEEVLERDKNLEESVKKKDLREETRKTKSGRNVYLPNKSINYDLRSLCNSVVWRSHKWIQTRK